MASPIAEAFVRLRPDLTGFRAELEAGLVREVAAIRVPPVRVPTAAVAASAPDVRALEEAAARGAAAQEKAATTSTRATTAITASQRQQNRAIEQGIAAQLRLNAVEEAAVGATTALAAAQREVSAARTALTAATRALALAQQTENAELVEQNALLVVNARERLATAVAATQSARAEQLHGTQLRQTGRGAAASALSFLGLRGATLAATGSFLAGAAAVTALGRSLGAFSNFEQTLNVFQATTGATAAQMERVSEAARALGADMTLPAVTAGDAADAMSALARAGLSVEQSIAAARGVLQLATAAQIDNASATTLVANALNSFSLSGDQAVHVADLLANAANASQGEITDFGDAMAQLSAVASQVGVSLEDTTALLTLAARAGLRGSDAGTSFRTALLRLAAPTSQANELLRSLGINIRNLEGEIRPEVFADFARATENLAPDLRDAAAAAVFGQDAIRAALLTGRQGAAGLQDVRDQIARQGTAAELAAAQTKGLAGEVEGLSSELNTLGTNLGGVASPAVEGFLSLIRKSVGSINDMVAALRSLDIGGAIGGADEALDSGPLDDFTISLQELGDGFVDFGDKVDQGSQALAGFLEQLPGIRQFREDIAGIDSPLENVQEHARAAAAGIEEMRRSIRGSREAVTPELLGLDNERILGRVRELRGQLIAALNQLEGIDPTSELGEKTRQNIDDIIAQLRRLGEGGRQAILESAGRIAPALGQSLREAVSEFTGIGDLLKEEVPADINDTIQRLAALGPEGQRVLRDLGRDLTESLAKGEEDGRDRAVQAARRTLRQAIEAAQETVQDAVRSARSNLESLGTSLAQQVAQVIETAPMSGAERALDDLRSALERLQEAATRRRLRFDLTDAQRDLAAARESLQQLGAPTAAQARARQEFLDPFIQRVADARSSLKEFTLEDQIEEQEKLRDAAAKTAEEGIQRLVDKFERGQISAEDFAAALRSQVSPALAALPKANLGFTFTRDFRRNLDTVVEQAKALAGFLGTAGTEPGPQVGRPAEAVAAGRQRISDAQQNLQQQLRATQNTERNTRETTQVLRRIETALTRAPAGRGGGSGRQVIRLGGGEVVVVPTNK